MNLRAPGLWMRDGWALMSSSSLIEATAARTRWGSNASPSRRSHSASTSSGGSIETALLITVVPPTHIPWSTWSLKSRAICNAPSR